MSNQIIAKIGIGVLVLSVILCAAPRPQVVDNGLSCAQRESNGMVQRKNRMSACALVLDLDGDGLVLVKKNERYPIYWDMDNDDFREQTAWIGHAEGFLAIDHNGDGHITQHSELLGTGPSGFESLAAHDENKDGKIDAQDSFYARLLVWIDADHNGMSVPQELHDLKSLRIASINLRATRIADHLAGNYLMAQSTFVMTDGRTRPISEVSFHYNNVLSTYNGAVVFRDGVLTLPKLRGSGILSNTYYAMSKDEKLYSMMQDIAVQNMHSLLSEDFDYERRMEAFMYQWAGVADHDSAGRGGHISDDRKLGFLEKFYDDSFCPTGCFECFNKDSVVSYERSFYSHHSFLSAYVMLQTDVGKLLKGLRYYVSENKTAGYQGMDYNVLHKIEDIAQKSKNPLYVWQQVVRMIHYTMGLGDLHDDEQRALVMAIHRSAPHISRNLTDVEKSIRFEATDVQKRIHDKWGYE